VPRPGDAGRVREMERRNAGVTASERQDRAHTKTQDKHCKYAQPRTITTVCDKCLSVWVSHGGPRHFRMKSFAQRRHCTALSAARQQMTSGARGCCGGRSRYSAEARLISYDRPSTCARTVADRSSRAALYIRCSASLPPRARCRAAKIYPATVEHQLWKETAHKNCT
jgi:hypothetical protein